MNTIRNYFSHCNQEVAKVTEKRDEKQSGFIPDPKDTDSPIDFQSLYNDFIGKEEGVAKYLAKVFVNLGGVLIK